MVSSTAFRGRLPRLENVVNEASTAWRIHQMDTCTFSLVNKGRGLCCWTILPGHCLMTACYDGRVMTQGKIKPSIRPWTGGVAFYEITMLRSNEPFIVKGIKSGFVWKGLSPDQMALSWKTPFGNLFIGLGYSCQVLKWADHAERL